MNDADIDKLTMDADGVRYDLAIKRGRADEDRSLRIKAMDFAIDIERVGAARSAEPNTNSVIMAAARILKFLKGDVDANLHSQE